MIVNIEAGADEMSASEALYGFMGWLTCRKNAVTFSHVHNAGTAVDLIAEFCRTNSLQEPREDWTKNLTQPSG